MDKEKLIDKIKNLQGLTNDEKADLLGLLRSFKKYGLVWEEKLEEVEERLREEIPVLTEVKERAIISDSADAPNHILIEGDNLEALTTLSYTHEGAIDVIYIDPPYNTGNKDFIYNDKFVDAEDEYRHSKWLSFMSKRLRIAKRLLSDKGVIFISIDENEVGHLRVMGDEIFGNSNFVGQWNWFKSATPPALSKKIKRTVEYILCWCHPRNNDKFKGVQKVSSSNDPFTKPQNSYKELLFPVNSITCKFPDGVYHKGVYGTDKFPNELLDDMIVVNGVNNNAVRFRNRFIWVQDTLDKNIREGLYIELSKKLVLSYKRKEYNPEVPPNFIDINVGVDTTENAGRQLVEIFGKQTFDYPKPISLIKYLVNFSYADNLSILDFFAGSGTTLHATMQLNAEDGGNRKCILVTNNENGICENVTYMRNKKVIEGYTTPKGEEVAGLTNNTLRYYRTKFLPRERSPRNMRALVSLATDLLCIKEDLYTEQKMFGKYPTHPKLMRYFANDKKQMLILYKEEAVFDIVEEIKNMEFNGKLKIYIFTPGRYPFSDDFFEVQDKVELVALPAAIYDAYTRVLPKRKEKYLTPEKEGEATPQTLFNDNEEGEE